MGSVRVILLHKTKEYICENLCKPIKVFNSAAILANNVLFYTTRSFFYFVHHWLINQRLIFKF